MMRGLENGNRTGRIRTCNQGIMRTYYGFRRLFRVWGLDHTFTLRACRLVSTPSATKMQLSDF